MLLPRTPKIFLQQYWPQGDICSAAKNPSFDHLLGMTGYDADTIAQAAGVTLF
jgi:hypothetical protein